MKPFFAWLALGAVAAVALLVLTARAEVSCEGRVLERAQPLGERLAALEEKNAAPGSWFDGPEGAELASIRVEFEALQEQMRACARTYEGPRS